MPAININSNLENAILSSDPRQHALSRMSEKRPRDDTDSDDDMKPVDHGAELHSFGGPMTLETGASAIMTGGGAVGDNGGQGAVSALPTEVFHDDLRQLLDSMDDFVPTIPEAVTQHYLRKSGFSTSDPRV